MTEVKKRKVHSATFKAQVALEAVRGEKTVSEIAHLHCVHPVMVSQWKKEILTQAHVLFEAKRGPKSD
jgi:transposase